MVRRFCVYYTLVTDQQWALTTSLQSITLTIAGSSLLHAYRQGAGSASKRQPEDHNVSGINSKADTFALAWRAWGSTKYFRGGSSLSKKGWWPASCDRSSGNRGNSLHTCQTVG